MTSPQITLLEPSDARWRAFAAAHPEATIFHHPAWMELLQACYGYRPALFALLAENGELKAALPFMQVNSWLTGRRIVSLPFSDFCPPLAADAASLNDLLKGIPSLRQQESLPDVYIHWDLPAVEGLYPVNVFMHHITCLTPESARVFSTFSKMRVQRQIRKAEQNGVTVKFSNTYQDLRQFYDLHLGTRHRHGAPIQPLRFFHMLWEYLIARDLGFVMLAYKDNQLLAGAVFLCWNRTITYKYGASDPAYWHVRPNHQIFWQSILWGCEHGYSLYDWGRTDPGNAGLRNFKLGWGSEEQLIHYSVFADNPPQNPVSLRGKPLRTSFLQHAPDWVCRLSGELFYGHFA